MALLIWGHLSREPEQCRYVEKCPGERGQQGQRPEMGLNSVYSMVSKGAAQKGVSEMKLEGDQKPDQDFEFYSE